jgi:hypothetical protein
MMGVVTAETGATGGSDSLSAFCEAVAGDLQLLASLHDVEPDAEYLGALRRHGIEERLGLKLESERAHQALTVLLEGLNVLPKVLDRATLDELATDFASIYLTHAIQASPQESVWIDEEHLVCQESMFQVRAWYEQYGLGASDWRKRPDDHLAVAVRGPSAGTGWVVGNVAGSGAVHGRAPAALADGFCGTGGGPLWYGLFCGRRDVDLRLL